MGQANYSAAKAGIATFTVVAAAELGRYGATVNAIAPSARTRMTETTFAEMMAKPDEGFDRMAPDNVAPLVVWLGSEASADVTGRVFEVEGGVLTVADGLAPRAERRQGRPLGARPRSASAVADLLGKADPPVPVYGVVVVVHLDLTADEAALRDELRAYFAGLMTDDTRARPGRRRGRRPLPLGRPADRAPTAGSASAGRRSTAARAGRPWTSSSSSTRPCGPAPPCRS